MSLLDSISILYEDPQVIVINKPAGLIVHPDGKRKEESVTDWMLGRYPDTHDVGEPITLSSGEKIFRPGVVHRIDRETSGALILAKTQQSFLFLKQQFQERDIAKEYHCFTYGAMPKKEDTINRPIGRSRNNFRQWSAQRGARGTLRDAITDYRVIIPGKEVSFVKAEPKTGRTHQIRVHFKAINHPVVCDSLYAPKQKPLLGFTRLALHAYSIEFKDLEGKLQKITAPYPEDFQKAVDMMKMEE